MASILRFLFPIKPEGAFEARLLLAARIVFGILLMSHGLAKWSHFGELSTTFPDPLGVGHRTSLVLAIFAEVFCSAGFVLPLGAVADDFHDVRGVFRRAWRRRLCRAGAGVRLSGVVRADVCGRTGQILPRSALRRRSTDKREVPDSVANRTICFFNGIRL